MDVADADNVQSAVASVYFCLHLKFFLHLKYTIHLLCFVILVFWIIPSNSREFYKTLLSSSYFLSAQAPPLHNTQIILISLYTIRNGVTDHVFYPIYLSANAQSRSISLQNEQSIKFQILLHIFNHLHLFKSRVIYLVYESTLVEKSGLS